MLERQLLDDQMPGTCLPVEELPEVVLLKKARGYLEKGFCHFNRGLDSNGYYVEGNSDRAVQWCALGAIDKAMGHHYSEDGVDPVALRAMSRLYSQLPEEARAYMSGADPIYNQSAGIANYNNHNTQEDVLALFDKAIAA